MKQLEIKTNKRLLIVELHEESEYEIKKEGIVIKLFGKYQTDIIKGDFRFICKGPDLTEDIAKGFIEFKWMPTWGAKDYVNENNHFTSALESFISAIESKGYHWGENPVKEPRMSDYGWYASGHPEEDSGWMYEDGEDKYYESLKLFEESESRTFNPSKCIIFEIL